MRRGLRFTEQMKGWLSFDETDFNQALLRGRATRTSAKLRLTIEIRDLDAFVDERSEWASAWAGSNATSSAGGWHVESGQVPALRPARPAPPADALPRVPARPRWGGRSR